jgi:uncharacterized protein
VRYVIALSVLLAMVAGSHWFLYDRLVRKPRWSRAIRWGAGLGFVGFGLLVPVAMVGVRMWPRPLANPLGWVAFTWVGCVFFLGLTTAAVELVHLPRAVRRRLMPALRGLRRPRAERLASDASGNSAHGVGSTTAGPSPAGFETAVDLGRRRLLAGGAAALGAGGALWSFRSAQHLDFPEVEVWLPRWPKALSGLTLVQLSDVHIGPLLGAGWLRSVVQEVNRLRPDLVVVTGDLVDGSVRELREHVAPLARVRARYGRFFVTGNHDYYSGADAWCQQMRRFGYRVLRNEFVRIEDGRASFQLAGIDDFFATGGKGLGSRLGRELDDQASTVLLAHQPRSIEDAVGMGAELQVSGHTHGGQLYPMAELVRMVTPYVAGLYAHDPRTQIYVSRGTGFVGPPMRFAAPAEVTRLVLVPA